MTRTPSAPTPPETVKHAKGWTLHSEAGPDMVGVLFGERFEVQEPIGAGGMASVYVCKDLALHGLAAVKALRDDNVDARRRFADEARLLANLRHPHLVQVLAVGETADGAPYMALEYLPGTSGWSGAGPCRGARWSRWRHRWPARSRPCTASG